MRTSINYLCGLSLLTALSLTPTAAFASKTVLHGSICQNIYPPEFAPYGEGVYHEAAGVRNSTNEAKFVVCPLVRVNGSGTLTDIEVTIDDTTGDMWCTVGVTSRYSTNATYETLYGSGVGDQVLDFGAVAGSQYEGNYYVFCTLPPASKVTSIVVDES